MSSALLREQLQDTLGEGYRLERELGGGGMSRVFLATETALGRRVVVKVLPPDFAAAVSAERFRREIQLAARLQHPHIVPLLSAGESGAFLYYTMPFVEGESLRDLLRREGAIPIDQAARIVRDVADALAYAHECGIAHRDVKPDNVLLSRGHALVADFGVAKALSVAATSPASVTATSVTVGTPLYMAPEQIAADPRTDHRADIYALGVVAYELLAGRPPFGGASPQALFAAHMTQAPEPLGHHRPGVPPRLEQLVMRCLEKGPADRPQSAGEVVRELDAVISSGGALLAPAEPGRFASADEFARSLASATTSQATISRRWPFERFRVRATRSRRAVAVAALVAVASGGAWAARAILTRGAPPVVSTRLAVLPFAVDGKGGLGSMAQGMVHLISRNLDGLEQIQTVDPGTVLTVAERSGGEVMDTAQGRAIAQRLGAGLYVLGSIHAIGGRLRIQAMLYDQRTGAPQGHPAMVEGDTTELFALVDRLSARLVARRKRGAGSRLVETAAVTTRSLAALKAFLDAEEHLRDARFDSALVGFRRAVAEDSTFALAHYRMAVAAGLADRWNVAVASTERALAFASRLAERDRRLLQAYDAFVRGAAEDAERQYRAFLADYPDDLEAKFLLGRTLYYYNPARGRRIAEARPMFDEVLAVDPDFLCPI